MIIVSISIKVPDFRIFLEEKFNLTREFCSNIESYSNTTEYTAVEQEVKIWPKCHQLELLFICRWSALTTSSPSPTTSFPSSCLSTSAAGVTSLDGSPSSASTWLVELSQPWQTSSTPSTWRSGVNGCGWPQWCRHWTWAVGSPPTSSCCTAS